MGLGKGLVARFKFIFWLIATILLSVGAVWLFILESQLIARPVHPAPQIPTPVVPFPSATVLVQTQVPLPSPTPGILIGPFVGQQAPVFSLKNRAGNLVNLEDNRGKVVLLNFWASWCIPCKEEMPLLQTAYEKYRDKGLVVLGINMTDLDDRQAIGKFIQETGVTFPILLDESGSVSSDYRVISIPTSFFIDPTGIIRHFQMGAMSAEQLQQYLNEMFK